MSVPAVPGLYEKLLTEALDRLLHENIPAHLVRRENIDPADAPYLLARHVQAEVEYALRGLAKKPDAQAALIHGLLNFIHEKLPEIIEDPVIFPAQTLRAIGEPHPQLEGEAVMPPRPFIPLSSSDLLVNARHEPRIGQALQREIPSADRIDLICAFIQWRGLNLLKDTFAEHLQRGRPLRVLTTTYMGATERRAIEALTEMGAEVRICYEEKSTRLHAKAWLLHRNSGFSTAYIGSSNLSHSAMMDGMEWNVRLSQVETPDVLEKFHATFEDYWEDPLFEPYDPEKDVEKLDHALNATRRTESSDLLLVDLKPYPHQVEILDRLETERTRHSRTKNLVVAATGTGKTMIAAFDFARWYREHPNATLLFVAHRIEILEQSLKTFRTVLRDGNFGELLVGNYKPTEFKHVFASIQSLQLLQTQSGSGVEALNPNAYDFVIVDEFHHAEARTYSKLLSHLKPKILVGLTATPERADGQSVLRWFDGHIAAEIRLWEALDRQLLVPFQYFGIHDNTDLSHLAWTGGQYNTSALERLYTADHGRVALIISQLNDKVHNIEQMKALGFCSSIAHAEFMAEEFNRRKISSIALTGKSPSDQRRAARQDLVSGKLQCIFTVDIFNEGVDIPEIDTVLFLRPTESATVFLQQLGRGLRHSHRKSHLTVLDFIGNAHAKFRYDVRYRALTGATRSELTKHLEHGFPYLPAGCAIKLDRMSTNIVLHNIKNAIGSGIRSVVDELQSITSSLGREPSLAEFSAMASLSPEELYQSQNWYWTRIRRMANLEHRPAVPSESELGGRLHRILHIDAADRLSFYRDLFSQSKAPQAHSLTDTEVKQLYMLHFQLWSDTGASRERFSNTQSILDHIWAHPLIRQELNDLLSLLDDQANHVTHPLPTAPEWPHTVPLSIHARYSLVEIRAAFGLLNLNDSNPIREGVRHLPLFNADIFFITLEKSEEHYSPQTMYRDYAISQTLFHWESQWNTTEKSATGQRYIHHAKHNSQIFLFVRNKKKIGTVSQPYTFLGPAQYVRHEGERPMAITWKLDYPMPIDIFFNAKVVAG